jgi:hypothetical protein
MPKFIQEAKDSHRCIEVITRKKSTFLGRNVVFFISSFPFELNEAFQSSPHYRYKEWDNNKVNDPSLSTLRPD